MEISAISQPFPPFLSEPKLAGFKDFQDNPSFSVEYLGIWEKIHNPDFNYGEFAIIKSQAGLHSYKISVKEWVAKTNAIGLKATAGRYGGTYAHKDIAFEFGIMPISHRWSALQIWKT